ncbi:transcription antitermination protein [Haloplanus halobius]|uniref:transcription antitermination protein n=1 Tax=Haloplanus halobius TaxID=2934938 RepID=UPI00200BADA0|nr:transcription antitermination protein [Haloplanus sp. XH21]
MDATTLVDTVTDDLETELSRLGSSKWLYALTDGEMSGDAVRTAAAADAAAAADRFESWAADADDPDAESCFDHLATTARNRHETLDADADADAADRRIYGTLADFDDPVERVGAALGHSLVTDRTAGQMVGFFVGDADPSTANTFRSLRDDIDDAHDHIVETLDAICASDDDWVRAEAAATEAIEAAYDDYVETLESMGVKPKNVC